jgi:phospholipid-binding lipoprotein MlaA
MRATVLAAMVGALVIGGAPAASAAEAHAPGDPWEKLNRFGYAVEGALDRVVIHPISVLFRNIAPGQIGHGIHNLIVNLSEPNAFVNDMLQGRVKRAGVPAGRFLTNSTIGLLGLFDVATHLGMIHHDNEFGVTLGVWGAGPGPYMYVPLIGPTTVRDVIGAGIDALIDPIHWASYANRPEISIARGVVSGLDKRVMTEAQLNALLSDAADPYATLRSVYLQNKEGEIHGQVVPLEGLPSFDDPAAEPAPQPATAGAVPVEDPPPLETSAVEPSAVEADLVATAPAATAPVSQTGF